MMPSPEGTPVTMAPQRSPLVMNVANFLRNHPLLKVRSGLLNNTEEVDFFRFKRLQRLLLSDEYKQKSQNPRNQLIPVPNEAEVAKIFVMMIQNRLLVPVEKLHYKQIKEVKGWKPNRKKPTLRAVAKATLEADAYYAWVYQKPNPYIMLYGFLLIAAVFAVVLFPLWPRFMRIGVWYLSMGCLGMLGLFFAMAIVRLIIFVITWALMKQAFWLYPNLFEDVGFFDSFRPVYAWSEPAGAKKLKKKSKKNAPKIEEVSEDIAELVGASGAEKAESRATKRAVTLEEVDE